MSKGKTAKGTAIKQIEMRRCVACREVRHKSELLRVVKNSAGEIFLDLSGKAPGRGSYVCKSPECADMIKKRRNLEKIFKVKIPSTLYDVIKENIHVN